MRLHWKYQVSVWLALVALIGQLIVSTIHSHAGRSGNIGAAQLAAVSDNSGLVSDAPCAPPAGKNDGNCPVCWVNAVAGAVIAPVDVFVGVASTVYSLIDQPPIEIARQSLRTLESFQARAPPFEPLV